MPPLLGKPPAPTVDNSVAEHSHIVSLLAVSVYSYTCHPCAESFTLDSSAQDSQHNTGFDPDMLTDKGTSTGQYTSRGVVMQLKLSLKS